MLNPERGEMIVCLMGQRVLMRPTFEALRRIEFMTGQSIASLIAQLERRGVPACFIRYIIAEGIRAAGAGACTMLSIAFCNPAKHSETVYEFLLLGLACNGDEHDYTVSQIPWGMLMQVACRLHGYTPEQFWRMTVMEFLQVMHVPHISLAQSDREALQNLISAAS